MQKRALDLVMAVYRVTKLFPEGEVLIGQIRKTANEILSEIILRRNKEIIKHIQIILNYFEIAKDQKWIKDANFDILIREYNGVLNSIEQGIGKKKIVKNKTISKLNQRQNTILEKIKNLDKFRLKDLNVLFPNLNSRTLMRDLDQLIENGLMKREGRGRGSYYKIVTF